ncbi:MAG: acetyltransferase [Aquabacterium sp.]|jgi:sugar O-acyltransferase (sialic acid O-acetyltransferase NeuD family)|uniref:acetyltransferase n=1 Tax=Aquabacterium sp. TaxID=1872578 RepID=UPI003BB14864
MLKTHQLVIIGDSAFAEVAYECFTHDSPYEVVAFAVERAYLDKASLFGLPVVALEDLPERFPQGSVHFYAALVYTQLNRLRTRLYEATKAMGYQPASYISSRAFVWHNVEFGEHCFVFEDNTLQPFVKVGCNVVLWSGNHIGHHTRIQDHCFVSSHVVISGFCDIGASSFLGVNATIANNVSIGADNWLSPSVTVTKDTLPAQLIRAPKPEVHKVSTLDFFKVPQ